MLTDELIKENVKEIFLSYNDMIRDDQSETSVESYKDVNNFLEDSDNESYFTYSNESDSSSIYNSDTTDEKNIKIYSYVSRSFIPKKDKKYKKFHTVSYINNMNSIVNFPLKNYGSILISDKIRKIKNYQWKPPGKNIPSISSIKLSHKKAWDIGKEGCNGLLIENLLESYKKKKLNYIVLDGTNIENFLTVYTHSYQDTIKGVNSSILNTFSFYDLEEAHFLYDIKSIHIYKDIKKKKKTIILKDLNDNFFNAILVCMNEIIIYLKIFNLKKSLLNKSNKKKKKKNLDEEIYFVKSVKNENNLYKNRIKDVISANKRKSIKYNFTDVKNIEKGNVNNLICLDENNDHIKDKLKLSKKFPSNNSEKFCYKYLCDALKKEENELKEFNKNDDNAKNEYTSHTSDSNEQ
ncbi:conserved Plasmodium protein, unknown function [Plasmodium gallinaceum]|uniref:Uncharacterized protein n=1 Tax=Plasmodium gallinaceum TaxID=5849 RepID=A0A1J1GZH0_PLAGA|nr:conserved Plasmodium protein, unknown function [Plasmodium gallinaceum]CRG96419.1 conserved Plasmodium protein, unknown function [Plasmodium gallinaceum]